MWRVVVGRGVSHHHPFTNHNLPHKRVVVFLCHFMWHQKDSFNSRTNYPIPTPLLGRNGRLMSLLWSRNNSNLMFSTTYQYWCRLNAQAQAATYPSSCFLKVSSLHALNQKQKSKNGRIIANFFKRIYIYIYICVCVFFTNIEPIEIQYN